MVAALDRGGTDLTRDFNYTPDSTFAVDLPNGRYDVIVTLGDTSSAHDKMGIFLEGAQLDTVRTKKGEFVTNTYTVDVGDSQLNLGLKDLGGSDPYVMINALEIALGGDAALALSSASLQRSDESPSPAAAFVRRMPNGRHAEPLLFVATGQFTDPSFASETVGEDDFREPTPVLVAPQTVFPAPAPAGPNTAPTESRLTMAYDTSSNELVDLVFADFAASGIDDLLPDRLLIDLLGE